MAKRKIISDPIRLRIADMIDAEVECVKEHMQRAQDLADLLNAFDPSGDKIEIDGNVVVGMFKKEAE